MGITPKGRQDFFFFQGEGRCEIGERKQNPQQPIELHIHIYTQSNGKGKICIIKAKLIIKQIKVEMKIGGFANNDAALLVVERGR